MNIKNIIFDLGRAIHECPSGSLRNRLTDINIQLSLLNHKGSSTADMKAMLDYCREKVTENSLYVNGFYRKYMLLLESEIEAAIHQQFKNKL